MTSEMLENFNIHDEVKLYTLYEGNFELLSGGAISEESFNNICTKVLQKIDDVSFNIHATSGITYTKDNALSNALLALHHAKKTHKPFLVYDETDNLIQQYENNLVWTKCLKEALNKNLIVVFVQAIVDA